MKPAPGDITELFRAAERESAGSEEAATLFAALYDELHRLAERQLQQHGSAVTLSTTTLVHEAYLDICRRSGTEYPDRARFIGYAARAMRGIVIDYVRYSRATKRGGGAFEITLTGNLDVPAQQDAAADLERLSDGLEELEKLEPSLARLVDLHFFCGYEFREIAEMQGQSERTVQRAWRKARLLLRHALLQPTRAPGEGAERA
jgi:RNA polymerase sigma factor (TIGR02999 family)